MINIYYFLMRQKSNHPTCHLGQCFLFIQIYIYIIWTIFKSTKKQQQQQKHCRFSLYLFDVWTCSALTKPGDPGAWRMEQHWQRRNVWDLLCFKGKGCLYCLSKNQKAPTQKGKHWKHIRKIIKDYVDSLVFMCITRDIQWLQYVAILRKIRLAPKLIGVPKGTDRLPTINVQGLFLLVSGRVVSGRRRIIILPCHCCFDTSLAVKVSAFQSWPHGKQSWMTSDGCFRTRNVDPSTRGNFDAMAFLIVDTFRVQNETCPEGTWDGYDGFRCWLFERKCPKNHKNLKSLAVLEIPEACEKHSQTPV